MRKELFMAVLVYILFFSIYNAFRLYLFEKLFHLGILMDIHIFYESMRNTIEGRGFFYNHYEEMWFGVKSHFGVHNSPILIFVLPLALLPTEGILIFQTVMIGFGAIALFYFAREVLADEKKAFLISVMYLLNPYIHGITKSDFHASALVIPFMFLVPYFYEKGYHKLALFSSLLVLFGKEDMGLFLISFGLFLLIKHYKSKKLNKWGIYFIFMGIAWIVVSILVIMYFNNFSLPWWRTFFKQGCVEFSLNGKLYVSRGELNLLTLPGLAFVLSIICLFGCTHLRKPVYLFSSLPLWGELLFSHCVNMINMQFVYTYQLMPFMFILFTYTLREVESRDKLLRNAFFMTVMFSILLSPVLGLTRITCNVNCPAEIEGLWCWLKLFAKS